MRIPLFGEWDWAADVSGLRASTFFKPRSASICCGVRLTKTRVFAFRCVMLMWALLLAVSGRILYNEYRWCARGPRRDEGQTRCPSGGYYEFAFLTVWTADVFDLYCILSVCTYIIHASSSSSSSSSGSASRGGDGGLPLLLKLTWILRTIIITISLGVTLLFWLLLGYERTAELAWLDLVVSVGDHGLNFVWMLLDMRLSPIPHKQSHVIMPLMFAVTYIMTTVFVIGVGRVNNPDGNMWVYRNTLDWRGELVLSLVYSIGGVCILLPLCHFVMAKLSAYCDRVYGVGSDDDDDEEYDEEHGGVALVAKN